MNRNDEAGRPASTDPRLLLVERFFSGTGSTYDLVANVFTLGIDRLWKRAILAKLPPDPAHIVDLAAGTGILTFALARRFPHARVHAVELRAEYLDIARDRARREGISNVTFTVGRAENFSLPHPVDVVTSSYLAKYADIPQLARAMAALLRPGGLALTHDFIWPTPRGLTLAWEFYMAALGLAGSRLFPQWRTAFRELPALIRRTTWVQDLRTALEREGFSEIRFEPLTLRGAGLVTAHRGASSARSAGPHPAPSPPG